MKFSEAWLESRIEAGVTAAVVVLVVACDSTPSTSDPAESARGPVYALQTMVYNTDDTVTSYVALSDTVNVESIELADAREFPSYAFITAVGGKLLVSAGEEPLITQYDITANLDWDELDVLSFANQGITGGGAGFERHWFLNDHVAYLTLEVTGRVVWNPSDFEIIGVMDDSELAPEQNGLVLDATFNRPPQLLEGPVLKPFYYRDEDWFRFGPSTPIVIYDPTTHAEQAILDVPCPALEVASQDEAGNTYFSPWTYGPTLSLFGEGPAVCIRRVKNDSTLDLEWVPDLTQWTGGRPVQVFRYMRDGRALASVLHIDEVEGDFSAGYDEDLAIELDRHWRLWQFDLEAEAAKPIEGIGPVGSGFNWSSLDERAFVFVPNEDWSVTKVYELDSDGTASLRFEVSGLVNNWVQVRQ